MINRQLVRAITAAFIFMVLIGTAICQMGGPMHDGTGRQDRYGKSAEDMMRVGSSMRHGAGMQGMGFMHSGAGMFGQYITFEVDNQTGAVTSYGIAGVAIFDYIAVQEFDYEDTAVMGALTRIIDSDGTTFIQVHDNPAAVVNIFSPEDYTVDFDLAEGTSVQQENNMLIISAQDLEVYIIYSADVTVDVSVDGGIVSVTSQGGSSVVVRAVPVNMQAVGQMHRMLAREVARNRVGAEVCLGRNGSISVANYSEQMRVQLHTMARDRIRMEVSSTDPAGRIMAFNLDNTNLRLQEGDRLRIHYDGVPMQCVEDPEEVFNATGAACWISQQSRERAQVMMYIPEFSTHTIEFVVEAEGFEEEQPPTGVPGFGVVTGIVTVLLCGYFKRKSSLRSD